MIVGIPGGLTLATLAVCWLGATAPAGRHVRPGLLARIARAAWKHRMGWPVHPVADLDDDDDQDYAAATQEQWDQAFAGAYLHWARAEREVTAEEWAAAMLRARAPHLFGTSWLDDMLASHAEWCGYVWGEIWTMKREAGISE